MTQVWRPRLLAFTPLGPELGVLPQPLSWTFTQSDDSRPTLDVHYPISGARSELIKAGCEVAIEYPTWSGPNIDRPSWTEPINARLVALDKSRDRMDRVETFKYSFIGIDYLLDRAWVQERDVQDPEEGDQRAERTFPGPGADPATFGRVFDKLWDEVIAGTGWGGSIVGHELAKDFGDLVDTNDVAWDVELPITVGLDEPLSNIVKRFVEADAVTVAWHGRTMKAYNKLTYQTDLTGSVVIRDSDFVVQSPQVVDWQPPATHVRIIGAEGRTWDFEDLGQAQPHGTPEMVMRQHSDCETEAQAERYADQAFSELKVVEHQTAEINFGASRLKPWRDYNLWTTVRRDQGRLSDESRTVDTVNRKVRSISVTVDGQGVRGHVIFGDRRRRIGERAARQLAEIGKGSRVGPGGMSRPPGDDPRFPDITAEAAPTLTFATVADHNNRPRGQIEITQLWDSSVPALDPDGEASLNPIKVAEWVYAAKRTSRKWKEILRAPADDTSQVARVEQLFDPDETILLRRAAVSHAGKLSEWVDLTSATWTADTDAALGTDQVVDPGHMNAAIRAKRLASAGAGAAFTLVSGEYVLDLTSTSPTVDYGDAGTPRSGRKTCRGGDVIVVDCEARYATGSSATLRVQVRFYKKDGTTSATTVVFTSAVTASFATYRGTATAPADAAMFAIRVTANALGAGATLRVRNLNADRRTAESRMLDDAVIARVVHATDNLTSKHTSTAALFQAASGSSGWKGGTSGLFFYDGAGLAFEAVSGGVYIRGSLEAGGILIESDVIDFGGAHTIAYTGSNLIFTAATGFTFNGAAQFNSTTDVDGGFTANTIQSDTTLRSLGAFGVNGNAPQTAVSVNAAATDPATTQALVNQLRALLIANGQAT